MKQKPTLLERFDHIFWSGDFNYRVNQTRDSAIEFIKENKYETLLKEDQMVSAKRNSVHLDNFKEGQIKFPPTYKYQVDSSHFDNKKKRTPAWTDRILYTSKEKIGEIKQLNYQSLHGVKISDHRPVYSQFVVTPKITKEPIEDGLVTAKTSKCNMF